MRLSGLLVLGLLTASVASADAFKQCAVCHGKTGERAALGGKSKVIKDMTKAEIASSLHGYKNGTYGGAMKAMMVKQVENLSDADIEAISNQIGK